MTVPLSLRGLRMNRIAGAFAGPVPLRGIKQQMPAIEDFAKSIRPPQRCTPECVIAHHLTRSARRTGIDELFL